VSDTPHPTLRIRWLGMHLRRLREEAGMTLKEASDVMERSLSSLSKIETGRNTVRTRDLRVILDAYRLEDEELRVSLLALLRDSRKTGWWEEHGKVLSEPFQDFLSLEGDAATIRNHETTVIPGLLQVEEYTRALLIGAITPAEIIDDLVAVRMARQAVLSRKPAPWLWAIIGEAALHQVVGGPVVMRAQLEHLLDASKENNVTIQVLPFSAGAHAGIDGPFLILEFPEYSNWTVGYVGSLAGSLYVEHENAMRRFSMVFDHLRASALSEADSRVLIQRAAEAL
jgi:transcriptional regulator with XRE-family HTH domain